MFKKLSGFTHNILATNNPELERELTSLLTQLQLAYWVAVVSSNGIIQGGFPAQTEVGKERISAMGAAMLSLGERMSDELNNGKLRYNFLVGDEGATLLVVLSPDYVLLLGLNQDAPLLTILERLQTALPPLVNYLQIKMLVWL